MNFLADFAADLRLAARMLRKSAMTSAMIVVCLGFSIGAVGTVFAWMESAVFEPLPAVPDVTNLVSMRTVTGADLANLSHPAFEDVRDAEAGAPTKTFSGIAASSIRRLNLRTDAAAEARFSEPLWGVLVTANYFPVLRVRPILGPGFQPDDDAVRGAGAVVIISHSLWQRRFNGATDVIGRRIWINNRELTVVGVAPPRFVGTISRLGLDVWIPITMQPDISGNADLMDQRGIRWLDAFGRLAPGATLESARTTMQITGRRLAAQYAEDADLGLTARTLDVGPIERMAPLFAVMLGIAVLVVLIVCSNVANLLLLRGAAREHEMAVRLALGARPDRVVRQLMTESLLLALGGVAVGMAVLVWARTALDTLIPATPLPVVAETPLNVTVVLVIAAVGISTIFVFGLAPAMRAARVAVRASLGGAGSTRGGSAGSTAVRGALVSAQFALSLAILVVAGLFLRRLGELQRVDRGFRQPEKVLLASLDFDLAGVRGDSARALMVERAIRQIEGQPGVRAVSAATFVPLGFLGFSSMETRVDGYTPSAGEQTSFLSNRIVGGYFATMGIPILRGRPIEHSDRAATQQVVVVNEAFARRFFGAEDPVGRGMRVRDRPVTIVGVAADGKYEFTAPLDEPSPPFIYVPYSQWTIGSVVLHVRTDGDPLAFTPTVSRIAASVDSRLSAMSPSSLDSYSSVPYLPIRLGTRILTVLGGAALILATLGLYAVIGYAVTQQRREIGIRMALGATPRTLVRHFLAYAAKYAGAGAVAGVLLAAAMAWGLAVRLPGSVPRVTTEMIAPFIVAVVVLGTVAVLAALVPANRAARVNPTVALREE